MNNTLQPGARVRFKADSPLYASGARTGTVTSTTEQFGAAVRRIARAAGLRKRVMLQRVRQGLGLFSRKQAARVERQICPVVRVDAGGPIPEPIEFPCSAEHVDVLPPDGGVG
jgi:hypothetical protein